MPQGSPARVSGCIPPAGALPGGVGSGLTLAAESSVHLPGSGCCPRGSSRGRAAGEGRCAMAGAMAGESVTFAGRPDQVREARVLVARLLSPSHPWEAVAVLLASELAANSVRHSGSAVPGETVT